MGLKTWIGLGTVVTSAIAALVANAAKKDEVKEEKEKLQEKTDELEVEKAVFGASALSNLQSDPAVAPATFIEATCEACGAIMRLQADRSVVKCPYCGSEKIIIDSNRERTLAYQQVEIEKQRQYIELQKLKIEEKKQQDKDFHRHLIIGLIIWALLFIYFFVIR